ncbi:MAG TPA: hypothetical protein GXX36_02620, partial [Clostridiaceae bacterium]|nr:hypothetical protein [Clostridiaceae bacterium]
MRILRLGGALSYIKRLIISTIIIAMALVSIIAPVYAEYSPASNDPVKLDGIPDKTPGDAVTITGSTTFAEITIKVLAPDKTILYVTTVAGGNFTNTFRLPSDAKLGIYEVVAGVGSIVATTTFRVIEETSPVIVSIDDISVTTKAGTAPVLPAEVTARYSDGSSKSVSVVWDEIDPSQYASAGTFTVEGTVEGTDIKATAVVTVEEVPPVIVSIDEVSVTTKAGTAPVLPAEVTARYSDGSSKSVAVVWDEIDPSQYASAGTFTVEGTVEGTDIKATAVVTVEEVPPVIVSIDEVNVTTKAGTAPVLPAEVTARY